MDKELKELDELLKSKKNSEFRQPTDAANRMRELSR